MKSLPINNGNVFISDSLKSDLPKFLKPFCNDKIFLLTDENTFRYCYPEISDIKEIDNKKIIVIKAGDNNKNIETLTQIWQFLTEHKADRYSLLINLGGGVVCDVGGFAAATFKRGLSFINIPTSLLAQVDASIGGKIGINFLNYKNEIGLFKQADTVIINGDLLKHLDKENILSGFAEIIKHSLLKDEKTFNNVVKFDLTNINYILLNHLVTESIIIKDFFVSADPNEKNIRKALNFGHTIGHAFETFASLKQKPIPHGYAVAYGMVCELYLSHLLFGFCIEKVQILTDYVSSNYGKLNFSKSDFDPLIEIMLHDKKNRNGQISFSLLKQIGEVFVDVFCDKLLINKVLEFYFRNK